MIEPIRVCELDAGRPRYQVPKFQRIAEMSRANTMAKPVDDPTFTTNSQIQSSAPTRLPGPGKLSQFQKKRGPMPEGEIVVKVGKLAWDNREGILKALGAIAKWFRGSKSEKGILILGSGGTGKTTLAPLLAGDFDSALNIPGEYEESLET
jgi:hypothetical protein